MWLLFERIIDFKSEGVFVKKDFIIDVWHGSKYVSELQG